LIAFGLVGLYALIVIWRLVSLLRAWRRTNQIVAGVFECAFPDWVQEANRAVSKAKSELNQFACFARTTLPIPITVGVFDRIVILPQRFAHDVSIDVLTSALGHEFQHIARHDYLLESRLRIHLLAAFRFIPRWPSPAGGSSTRASSVATPQSRRS
jgi:beta-lactamase regulating signal transducer with metallopeptidase domain